MTGPMLIFLTFLLVIAGGSLYSAGEAGWAQMLWVLASGTAGAGVGIWIESVKRKDPDGK
jgi:hypothetical protein